MSDELAVQGINPQVQPQAQKSSTVPYALGGAVVGGVAGGVVNHYLIKKPMSWEDVIKEAKDTTDFSSKKEPASWESVKAEAQKVADLEEKLKAVPEKTLAEDAAETKSLNAAKEAREKEFKRLFNEEKKAGEGIKSGIPAREKLDTNIPRKLRADYDKLHNEYAKIVKDMRNDASGEYRRLSDAIVGTDGAYDAKVSKWVQEYRAAVAADPKLTLKKYFATQDGNGKKTLIYDDMRSFYEAQLDATGKYKPGNHANPKGIAKAQKALRTKAHELTEKNLASMRELIEAQDRLGKIKFEPTQLNAAKIDPAALSSASTVDEIKNVIGKTSSSQMKRELGIILGDVKASKRVKADLISKYAGEFGCSADDVERVLSKRIKVVEKYEPTFNKIAKASDNSFIRGIYAQQRENYREGELKDVMRRFKKKFPDLCKDKTPLSDSEITTKVNKALEGTHFETDVTKAQEAYNKALESKGTVNTAAKEAAEKELAAAKDKLKTAAEELGKKVKTSGNKWLAAGIGAAIGAAALWGVAASKNKEA